MPGYRGTVHFTSSDPLASLPANYAFVSGDAGSHTVSVTFNTVGVQTVTATDVGTSSITGNTSVTVATITFTVTGPGSIVSGTPTNVVVTAMSGSTVYTGYRGTVHFTSSDVSAAIPANHVGWYESSAASSTE